MTSQRTRWQLGLLTALLALAGCAQAMNDANAPDDDPVPGTAQALTATGRRGAVYTSSNSADANALVAFDRAADGSLTLVGTFPTGGLGAGSGLGSQGALARSGEWLFVVNAGSNDISTFSLSRGRPTLVGRVASGGTRPISLTVDDRLLYALNAGGVPNISGFRIGRAGLLQPIADSAQPLSGAEVAPAEVAFAPDGDSLVVTEKNTNMLDTYFVDRQGKAHAPQVAESNGATPFGFAFTPRGEVIVSEAFGGSPNASAVSAYALRDEVNLDPISVSVPTLQTAACWVAIDRHGRYAYAANAGSGTISAYRIASDGQITLVGAGATGVTGPGTKPADLALSDDGRFLYVLNGGNGTIGGLEVRGDRLVPISSTADLSVTPAGLLAL